MFMSKTRRACSEAGCKYEDASGTYLDVCPYWRKVFIADHLLTKHENDAGVKWVVWIDSDGWLHDSCALARVLQRHSADASMLVSPDPPIWSSPFCAAAFAVRNDDSGRALVREWKALYRPTTWHVDVRTNKWKTDGAWAGDNYEQGSFCRHLLHRRQVAIVPWYVFCETDWERPHKKAAVIHLGGHLKDNFDVWLDPRRRARFESTFMSADNKSPSIAEKGCLRKKILE